MVASLTLRNDLLKSLYIGMLEKLDSETLHFWKNHPLELNGVSLRGAALLEHIWDDHRESPLKYVMRILEALEPFLVERGIDTEEFVDSISFWGNRGTFLNSNYLLKILNPFVYSLFSTSNVSSFILDFTSSIAGKLVHGLSFPILKKETVNASKHVFAMVQLDELLNQKLIPWDGYLYSAKLLKSSPKIFGLPAYDSVELLCDARGIGKIINTEFWQTEPDWREEVLYISGMPIGRLMEFSDFCKNLDLKPKRSVLLSCKGVFIEKDYYCPKRKRIVLRKGCFYGASAYLFKIVYKITRPVKRDFLKHPIHEATQEVHPRCAAVTPCHQNLLENSKESIVIEYRKSQDRILVGNTELRGAKARILGYILREHQKNKKTHFTFREIKYDKEIYHNHKNTGFEVSLERLAKTLNKSGSAVGLLKKGAGKFQLETEVDLDFREVQ